ncbi:MAG: bifunctional pyr operon transcriptional regulator/uracil phosphoribosyltransferase [Actinobacteria bacterium]|nr:bifunctional pyr operon transcriptional regulator/uracil phosphoribosyltransferase [Actinomycetota bacterium]
MSVALSAQDISRALTRISHEILEKNHGSSEITVLGIPTRGAHLAARIAAIMSSIEGKEIAHGTLDLYSGRTIRAALDALGEVGRPRTVQLAVLVDRGHRQLPIRADFVGKNLPTSEKQSVRVSLTEIDGVDEVVIEGETN